MTPESILLVTPQAEPVQSWLNTWLYGYPVTLYTAKSGLDALELYKMHHPRLSLIACQLPDMDGRTLSTILKDGRDGRQTKTMLFGVKNVLANTKADYFFPETTEALFQPMLHAQLESFFNTEYMQILHSTELLQAVRQQYQLLPDDLTTSHLAVHTIFSPYGELSGDSFNYWLSQDKQTLYGMLFDCTGHDINSFSFVQTIRMLLTKSLKLYEMGLETNLSNVLREVNQDLFMVDALPETPAAIIFTLDLTSQIFTYVPAGVPGFFYRTKDGKNQTTACESYLLGFDETATFEAQTLSLADVGRIILCSDGFFEIMREEGHVEASGVAKHDDISAIFLTLTP